MMIRATNTVLSHSRSSNLARMTYNSLFLCCYTLKKNSTCLVLLYLFLLTLLFFFTLLIFFTFSCFLAPVDCLISHSLCHHVITPAEGLLLKQQPQRQTVVLRRAHFAEVTSNTIMMPPASIFEVVSNSLKSNMNHV